MSSGTWAERLPMKEKHHDATTYFGRRSPPCWCAARSPQGLTSFSTGTRSRCPHWSVRARVRTLKHASWRSRSSPCSKPSTRSRATTSRTSEPSSRRRAHRLTPRQWPRRTRAEELLPAGAESRSRLCGVAGGDPRRLSQERRHCDGSGRGCANDRAAPQRRLVARRSSTLPASTDPGVWQLTPSCPAAGGVTFQWQNMTPFGVPSAPGSQAWIAQFAPGPPPALTSKRYARDYNEVKRVGNVSSDLTERPQDRADVARFYAASSPSFVFNLAARQVAAAEGSSLSKNARALALLNMASNDSLVASFWAKYHYKFWRPETAIREGNLDGNAKTDADITFVPYILTPCFPSYPSNHGSGSNSAAEVLRRVFGAGGHAITMANPAVPGVTFHYTQVQPDHGRHQRRARLRRHPFSLRSGGRRRSGTRHRRRTSTSTTSAARSIPTTTTKTKTSMTGTRTIETEIAVVSGGRCGRLTRRLRSLI